MDTELTDTHIFTSIGLSPRDKRVYEMLLKVPKASLRKLAGETGINRGSVYESVKQLTSCGLVGSIQVGKQQRFIASDPRVVLQLLREKQQTAREAEIQAEKYIASMTQQNREATNTNFAVYFEGDEGVAAILRDVLTTMKATSRKHYYVLSSKRIRQYMYNNFRNFTQQRIKQGVEVSVIAVGTGGEKDKLSSRRWLTTSDTNSNCYTIIYDTKTAFISIDSENNLSGIVIDNAGIASMQILMFQTLWEGVCAP